MRAGIISSVIANGHRDPKKKPEPFLPLDFMPFADKPAPRQAPKQDPADITAMLKHAFKHPSVVKKSKKGKA